MHPASLLAGMLAAAGRVERSVGGELRARFGANAILTNSGTSALQLALRLSAKRGAVALPAWGCYDIVSAAVGAQSDVVWYDIDPATLQPGHASLQEAVRLGVGSVVVVHAYGVPVDMPAIRGLVGADMVIIEDAAQGWGGALHETPLGSFGDFSVFSFGRGKGITGGSGGALVIRQDDAAVPPLGEAGAGWKDILAATALMVLGRPRLYGIPAALPFLRLGETVYKSPRPAAAISRAAAAQLRGSMRLADAESEVRKEHAARLRRMVDRAPHAQNVTVGAGADPGYLRLPVLMPDAATAAALVAAGGAVGIASTYPQDLPRLAGELGLESRLAGVPVGARELVERLVTLPVHGQLAEQDFEELAGLLTTI